MSLGEVGTIADAVRREVGKAIVGQDEAIELLLTALLAGGHILVEGVPGTGKTMLAQAFAATLSLQFGRIQFTPDMMPGDILGTSLFNFQTGEFALTPGPIFTQVLLADEINRTPPKTQAALLQAMNERARDDRHPHPFARRRLHGGGDAEPDRAARHLSAARGAQLDRFLFKISVGYPTRDEERAIVARHGHQSSMPRIEDFGIAAVADPESLAGLRAYTSQIRLDAAIIDYIVDVMRATREHPAIETGASTRAANMLASAVRSYAALNGRDFVLPDDVKRLAVPLVRHRIVMAPHAEIDGTTSDAVLAEILDGTAAPR